MELRELRNEAFRNSKIKVEGSRASSFITNWDKALAVELPKEDKLFLTGLLIKKKQEFNRDNYFYVTGSEELALRAIKARYQEEENRRPGSFYRTKRERGLR